MKTEGIVISDVSSKASDKKSKGVIKLAPKLIWEHENTEDKKKKKDDARWE